MLVMIEEAFERGGYLVMGLITAVLFLSLLIVLERIIRYWFQYDLSNSDSFMAAIQKNIMNNSIEQAIRLCKKSRPKILPYVLSEGLKRANDTPHEIEHSIDAASVASVPKVTKWVGFLGTMANVATLLGLLGTIFGLMKSFAATATATGAQKQKILAEGIAEALTATSFGLGTAMLCLLAYGILTIKQASIVDDIHRGASKLLELLYTRNMRLNKSRK